MVIEFPAATKQNPMIWSTFFLNILKPSICQCNPKNPAPENEFCNGKTRFPHSDGKHMVVSLGGSVIVEFEPNGRDIYQWHFAQQYFNLSTELFSHVIADTVYKCNT